MKECLLPERCSRECWQIFKDNASMCKELSFSLLFLVWVWVLRSDIFQEGRIISLGLLIASFLRVGLLKRKLKQGGAGTALRFKRR